MARSEGARQGMRCIQQISLLKHWERWRAAEKLPQSKQISAEHIASSIDKIMLSDVHGVGSSARFLVRFHGKQYEQMYGKNCVGQYLDTALPETIRDQSLESYFACLASAEPIFNVLAVRKDAGPVIWIETLHLPFRIGGQAVGRIATIGTLFSEENGFDVADISDARQVYPETTLISSSAESLDV